MSAKVLFAGCGLTGTATSWFLHRALHSDLYLHSIASTPIINYIDQAPQLGGRFSTHRIADATWLLHGQVDAGGQYLTRYRDEHVSVFNYLHETGVIHPFDATSGVIEGIKSDYTSLPHYLAPRGMSSIVSSLLSSEEQQSVRLSTSISAINLQDDGRLHVTCHSHNGYRTSIEPVDCLVLSMPPPALFSSIGGNIWQKLTENTLSTHNNKKQSPVLDANTLLEALRAVQYSSRFACAAYFRLSRAEYALFLQQYPWRARYVSDDPHIRYLSIDNFKYEANLAQFTPSVSSVCSEHNDNDKNADDNTDINGSNHVIVSILLHSSLPFYAQQQSSHASDADTQALLLQSLYGQLSWLRGQVPLSVQLLPWPISQCSKPLPRHQLLLHSVNMEYSADSNNIDNSNSDKGKNTNIAGTNNPHGKFDSSSSFAGNAISVDIGRSRIIFAGDYFTTSNFEGCLDSALDASQFIAQYLLAAAASESAAAASTDIGR